MTDTKPSRRLSLVKTLDDDVAVVEAAFADALGEGRATLPLSFEERRTSFSTLADTVNVFAANEFWRAHPLSAEMHDHAQRLQIACTDEHATQLDVEWLAHLRHLLPMVRRELAHQLVLDPTEAAIYLLGELRSIPVDAARAVLGTSPRALRGWLDQGRNPRTLDPERLVLAAQLVADLSRSLEPDDIAAWFVAPQDRLDGRSPAEVLDEPDLRDAEARLLPLSSSIAIFAGL